MAANPILKGLPPAATVSLFRIIDRQIRADPTLKGIIKTFRSWEGQPDDSLQPSVDQCPWIRLTPRTGHQDWWAASTQKGILTIDVELMVKGLCFDDLSGLWWAVMRSLYPADAAVRNAFQTRLNNAGAWKGTPMFNHPVVSNEPSDGFIYGHAWIALEYRFDVNPTSPGL